MKIRNGFVSNSSSCSFVISHEWDVNIARQALEKVMDAINIIQERNRTLDEILEISIVDKKFIKRVKEWNKYVEKDIENEIYFREYIKNESILASIKDAIVIHSQDDNSIPPEMMEFIQYAFGWQTKHFHWG